MTNNNKEKEAEDDGSVNGVGRFPHKEGCKGEAELTGDIQHFGDEHYEEHKCRECGDVADLVYRMDEWLRTDVDGEREISPAGGGTK